MKEIPGKQYFKIGEVARLLNEPPHVIRYWESEFPAIKPKRAGTSQHRLYRREDVELFLSIRLMLRGKGYTLAGARNVMSQDKKNEAGGGSGGNTGEMVTIPVSALGDIRKGLTAILEALANNGGLSD